MLNSTGQLIVAALLGRLLQLGHGFGKLVFLFQRESEIEVSAPVVWIQLNSITGLSNGFIVAASPIVPGRQGPNGSSRERVNLQISPPFCNRFIRASHGDQIVSVIRSGIKGVRVKLKSAKKLPLGGREVPIVKKFHVG